MLSQIPCHLIGGPLGAGKTSLLQNLLAQKPAGERWAILINEFGAIGLDAALLSQADQGISISEVAGGCVCCVNGAPFQVGLSRLLRQAQPQRLFIESSGLGHPLSISAQLQKAPWLGVLQLQPLIMVLDAEALSRGQRLNAEQLSAAEHAGLLLLNKSAGLSPQQRAQLEQQLPSHKTYWTEHAQLPLSALPHNNLPLGAASELVSLAHPPLLGQLGPTETQPICQLQQQTEGWAIGWRWHPSKHFDQQQLSDWLTSLNWQRAKLIVQQSNNALALNAVAKQPLNWQNSPWRRDSRIELIFAHEQDKTALEHGLAACIQQ